MFRTVATRSLDPAVDAFLRARTFAPGRETLAGRVALTGEVVHIPDITTDPDWRLPESATIAKNRTALGVPLLRDGLVVGFGARAAGPITGPESPQSGRSPDRRFNIQRRRPRAVSGRLRRV